MSRPQRPLGLEPEFELLYLLAGSSSRRAELRGRARDALARVDFDRLGSELHARRLLPLIGTRSIEAAGDLCTEAFRSAVARAVTTTRARGLAIEAETRDVASLLAQNDIPALPLKGPLLATAAHGDLGLRQTDDIDMLVPRERLHEAARLLAAEGYGEATDRLRANGLPDLHLGLQHPTRATVELHWRVHWYEEDFSARMLARAHAGDDGLLRPAPDDLAAALLLFYARDGFHGVRLAADIAAWWDRHGARLDPGFAEGYVPRHPEIARALTAAATAAEQLTGAPALDWLGSSVARGRRVSLAVRLADWTQAGDRDQLAANISLADGLLAPVGSARSFARRQLVPKTGAALPHAAKMLGRYALALWRIRGGRRWIAAPN